MTTSPYEERNLPARNRAINEIDHLKIYIQTLKSVLENKILNHISSERMTMQMSRVDALLHFGSEGLISSPRQD